jgi:hypothetical protein
MRELHAVAMLLHSPVLLPEAETNVTFPACAVDAATLKSAAAARRTGINVVARFMDVLPDVTPRGGCCVRRHYRKRGREPQGGKTAVAPDTTLAAGVAARNSGATMWSGNRFRPSGMAGFRAVSARKSPNPHAFRQTIVAYGRENCVDFAAMQAWAVRHHTNCLGVFVKANEHHQRERNPNRMHGVHPIS